MAQPAPSSVAMLSAAALLLPRVQRLEDEVLELKKQRHIETKRDPARLQVETESMEGVIPAAREILPAMNAVMRCLALEEIAKLKEENAKLMEENAVVKDDTARLKDDVGKLKDEAATMKEHYATLKEDNASLKADITVLKAEKAKLEDENVKLKNQNTTLEGDFARLKEEIAELETLRKTEGEELTRLRARIADFFSGIEVRRWNGVDVFIIHILVVSLRSADSRTLTWISVSVHRTMP